MGEDLLDWSIKFILNTYLTIQIPEYVSHNTNTETHPSILLVTAV